MATVFDTAKYILSKTGKVSTMKLQKLCYYAQAWSLVWDDAPLFNEDFETWVSGPVCRELFTVMQGQFYVEEKDKAKGDIANLSDDQKDSINAVLNYYGDKDDQWLSQLSQMEQPWKEARKGIPFGAGSANIIPKDSMAVYYGGLQ